MKHPKHAHRGSALIEFAGSLILLFGVFVGIFQIGYTFFAYNTLVNAVRAAARYASLQQMNAGLPKTVKNMVVYGDLAPAANAKPIVPGLTTDHVNLTLGPATATVSIRGFKLDSLFSQVRLDGRPSITFPLTGGANETK
jgi:Flp pilus assembly protein TadG